MRGLLEVSVIICAYTEDRWDDLVAAVASVQHQTVPPREIVVVIDHNPALLERARFHILGVVVVENQEAPGASGSRNSGVARARGEVIAFLDDDAEAVPDWLEQLVSGYQDTRILGIGGSLEPVWVSGRPDWFPEEFNWVVGCTYKGMPESTAPVRNVIAANMSLRREVFDTIGGFRRGFGKVGIRAQPEETELCIRALQRLPQNIWLLEPRAKVHHKVPPARANWGYFLRRCYDEGFGKALLSRLVGARDGLASEQSYALRTLPRGFAHGVGDALLRGDLTGLARAGTIIAGLAITTAGYIAGSLIGRLAACRRDKVAL